jgi:hypothetical protein
MAIGEAMHVLSLPGSTNYDLEHSSQDGAVVLHSL